MTTTPERWLDSMRFGRSVRHLLTVDEAQLRRSNAANPRIDVYRHDSGEHRTAVRIACDDRSGREVPVGTTLRRSTQAVHVFEFLRAAKPVFRLTPSLRDVLLHTDLDGVDASELRLPFHMCYLQIPDAPPIDGVAIDGLLLWDAVDDADGREALALMPCPVSTRDWDRDFVEPVWIHRDCGGAILDAAIAHADEYAMDEDALRATIAEAAPNVSSDMLAEILEEMRDRHRVRLRAVDAMRPLLPLALNAILYVDNCLDDRRPGWPAEAPRHLVEKAAGRGRQARQAEDRLARSWTRIVLCDLPDAEARAWGDSSSSVRQHWRRGHWRLQAHGPAKRERKRIRISPTLVRRGVGDEPPSPSYLVGDGGRE